MVVSDFGDIFFSTGVRRETKGFVRKALRLYASLLSLWVLYTAVLSKTDVLSLSIVFLSLMLVPSFILIGSFKNSDPTKASKFDWVLSSLSLVAAGYFFVEIPVISTRISLFNELSVTQYLFASLIIILTLEITRRAIGLLLVTIVLLFIIYNLFGHLISGNFGHGIISASHFLDINVFTSDGLFGVPVRVAATYAFLFVLFGTFLEQSGGSNFFFRLASCATGKYTGGSAKIAVVSSALFGTMSGSPTSDVVATGSITIPLMKKNGYPSNLAGGIEVAASTGGSLLPPVMGSAAFIMAEFTGISYISILKAALFPAILYYLCLFIQVHLRSLRLGLVGVDLQEDNTFFSCLSTGWYYFLPLVGLVLMLFLGYSPTISAAYGIFFIIVCSQFDKKNRLTFGRIYEALSVSAFRMIGVTAACAAAGLVIGGITMTGLASKFSVITFAFAGENMFFALFFAGLVTIILGLGMPTPSAYILSAILVAPTLVTDFNIPLLNAHFFIFYFAVVSAMTPPVAVAAYAASAISNSNPIHLAITSMRLSIIAFILPFVFITFPNILEPSASFFTVTDLFYVLSACIFIAFASERLFDTKLVYLLRSLLILNSFVTLFFYPDFRMISCCLGWLLLIWLLQCYRLK